MRGYITVFISKVFEKGKVDFDGAKLICIAVAFGREKNKGKKTRKEPKEQTSSDPVKCLYPKHSLLWKTPLLTITEIVSGTKRMFTPSRSNRWYCRLTTPELYFEGISMGFIGYPSSGGLTGRVKRVWTTPPPATDWFLMVFRYDTAIDNTTSIRYRFCERCVFYLQLRACWVFTV